MKLHPRILLIALAALTLPIAMPRLAADEPPALSAKGIYYDVDRHQRSGLKFCVTLDEDGKQRQVPTSHPFRSGDRFTFSFEINRGTYIYVINRTENGMALTSSAGYQAKRITRTRLASHRRPSSRLSEPRLLFPTYQAGSNNRLTADVTHEVPHKGYFAMDDDYGLEKLYVVISDRRLDFSDFFYAGSGAFRHATAAGIARLEAKLERWKDNAFVELVAKGIVYEPESYGVSIDPSQPAVVEIDLKHYR